ncbi:acetyltransferase [Arenicella sp. 4NH20-0111]|uniref:acetyltransferase n=1 Tax=Arenicella sp. 4NH20-0111 TaxID=3127648 RepID=UPI003109507F
MSRKLVIFGSADMAELAKYYFDNDSDYEVVAFTLDAEYLDSEIICGLPAVPFDQVVAKYSPEQHDMFIALSYSQLNKIRKDKFTAAKEMGYTLASYISSHATVLNDGAIGENCFLLEDNTIQPFVRIGDNVTLWSGNHIGHHSTIGAHTFIASHVVVSGGVNVGRQCFIGVNATLRDHIDVGDLSVVGAGVLMLKSCDEASLLIGKATPPSGRKSTDLKRI